MTKRSWWIIGSLIGRVLAIALLVNVLTCGAAWAQAVSQSSGSARDQTGAVVPGVEITAIQTATGVRRTAVTKGAGEFVASEFANRALSDRGCQTRIQDLCADRNRAAGRQQSRHCDCLG